MAKSNGEVLSTDFLAELFAIALQKRTIFEIVRQYLKYSYIQEEPDKRLFQYMVRQFDRTGRIPTIGQLKQNFIEDEQVLDRLVEIDDVDIDSDDLQSEQVVIESFENFIKKMKFLDGNDKITDLYNKGKREEAWKMFVNYAEEFSKFSIQDAKFETVFNDFSMRQANRMSEDYNKRFKIATGIDEFDESLGGGPETGEYVLWLGDSGSGKSQLLIQVGIAAARQGKRVAHFQLEGTKEQCLNRYDAAWTGTLYQDVKVGNIPNKKLDAMRKVINRLRKHDIIVSSEESFNAKTLVDVRRELKEMERKYGKVDVIILDYLELLEPGDGHNYSPGEERFRQAKLSKGMKMLAMEFNAVVHAATQSSNIPEEQKQDPDFVLTRSNLNEDKGKCRPADVFASINQTRDEKYEEILRLHIDKAREYAGDVTFYICTNFPCSRFYDRQRSLNFDPEEYRGGSNDD